MIAEEIKLNVQAAGLDDLLIMNNKNDDKTRDVSNTDDVIKAHESSEGVTSKVNNLFTAETKVAVVTIENDNKTVEHHQ